MGKGKRGRTPQFPPNAGPSFGGYPAVWKIDNSASTREKVLRDVDNFETYAMYYNDFVELAVSMFDWTGLPDEIDPRYLEMMLVSDGVACFFKDPDVGYAVMRVAAGGPLDIYATPTRRDVYALSGYHNTLDESSSVLMYNNFLRRGSLFEIDLYARRVANIERTIDVNVRAQKTPALIKCSESQRLTVKNMYEQYDGNSPVIFGVKDFDTSQFQCLSPGAPAVYSSLYELKTRYINECLTKLGISNVNYEKKERLISDEVSRNMGGTIARRYTRLKPRQQACERINRMFGLDVWVEFSDDYREIEEVAGGEPGEEAGLDE